MAMNNRSIAAFIKTNRTRMNSVTIFCPVKVRAKKNAKSNDPEGAWLANPRQEQKRGRNASYAIQ